jgi:hypothetical protein
MNGNQSSSRNTALLGGLLALGLILGNWILGAQIKATRLSDRYVTVKGLVPGIMYNFNGLNSIKPDMITEASRNASAAADRFAADSGSMVGSIRQANQGVFAILAADEGNDTTEPGEFAGASFAADSSLMKTVRIVATVRCYLEK